METQYNNPDEQENTELSNDAGNNTSQSGNMEENTGLAPNTDNDNEILNDDGSLGDLPEEDVPGRGANEGTVGLGT